MFRNYFKVALRSFAKQKGSAFLNMMGLAVGLASVILIFIYIKDEVTYDKLHPNPDLTFGIGDEFTNEQGEKRKYPAIPTGWAQLMKDQIPEVEEAVRWLAFGYPYSMRNPEEDKVILTQDGEVFIVDKSYPDMMYFPLLYGNPQEVFSQPNSVVLSANAAKKLFGEENVVGRQLELKHIYITNQYVNLKITGVIKDYPYNMHMRPDFLIPMEFLKPYFQDKIGVSLADFLSGMDKYYLATYIKINDKSALGKVEQGLDQIIKEHLQDKASQHHLFFKNIAAFHFDKEVDWSWWDDMADFNYIIVFGSIGLLILLIACINYMNLATAKSAKRSREVGVRKSLGSGRWALMLQFFQESLLTTFLALVMALLLVIVALPAFNNLADKHFTLHSIFQPDIFLALIAIWWGVAILAGSYPAIFLSGFKPVEVLKGKFNMGKGPARFRKVLVVSQFVVSALLIISTGIILEQMDMLQGSKLYDKAGQILSVRYGGGIAPISRYQTLKNEILTDPEINEVTLSVHLPRRESFGTMDAYFVVPDVSGDQVYNWKLLNGEYNFPEVFDLDFVAGRSFDLQNVADSNNYIMNETAVRNINLTPDQAIGLIVEDTASNVEGRVIGVVKDFPYESIFGVIKPMVIQGKPNPENQILYVKLPVNKLQEKLTFVEKKWKEVLPGVGFDHWFLSDEFGRMYYGELKMTNLVKFFSILAIFIACLGLYGLASYTAEQKTKEIGIRKALGATIPQILGMLVTTFVKMICIAFVVALPVGYWIMHAWLQNFVYRVDINWAVFALSIAILLGLTLATVAYESIKASIANPIKSLRYE